MISFERQVAHVKQNRAAFEKLLPGWTVDAYFKCYSREFPDLYVRLCRAMKIEAKQ